jgi:hypothetical protein
MTGGGGGAGSVYRGLINSGGKSNGRVDSSPTRFTGVCHGIFEAIILQ